MDERKPDAMTEAEINRILLNSEEQNAAEIWKATAREALNTAGQSVYLVPDETDAMTLQKYGKLAIDITPKKISVLLDIITQDGVTAYRLFIPKAGNDSTSDKIKTRLETGLREENIPMGVYVCPLPDGMKSISECEAQKPGVLLAWISNNDAVIQQEREEYRKITGTERMAGLFDYIEDSKKRPVISTGYPTLDLELGDGDSTPGGLTAGLYTIGGISSLGKTTFALQMADAIAAARKDVLIIALEMSAFELMAKSISRITTETARANSDRKTVQGILQGTRWTHYSPEEQETIKEAAAIYSELAQHLFIVEGIGTIGAKEVRDKVKRHIEMTGEAPVVIVDYLQILAPADPRATDKTNTDKAVLEMKRISRDYNIPVICISSFNRANYKEKVSMEALKESGAIEYSSDVVIGLQLKGAGAKDFDVDKEKSKTPREVEVAILKNRSGKTGQTMQFEYDPRFNLFKDTQNGHRYSAKDIDFSALTGKR